MTLVLLHGLSQDSAPLADLVQSLEAGVECAEVPPSADLLKVLAARPAAILLLGEFALGGDLAARLRAIRATRGGADTLITMVLGSSATAEKLAAVEAGVDDLLASPIEPVDFVVRMHRLLDTRRLRRAASAAQSEAARLRDGFTQIPGFVSFLDSERKILAISAEAARLLGRTPQEMVGGLPETFLHPRDAAVRQTFERDILQGGHAMPARAEELIDVGGAPHLCWIARAPVRDANGQIVGMVSCALPRTDDGEDEAVDVDRLTQLPTRRAAELRLDQLLAGSATDGDKVAAFLIGIRNSDEVNSQFGRVVADRARLALARRAQSELRGAERHWQFIARISEDAFVNLRSGPNFAVMEVDRELFRARLAEPYQVAGEEVRLDVVVTALRAGSEDTTGERFLDRADDEIAGHRRLASEAILVERPAIEALRVSERRAAWPPEIVDRVGLGDMLDRRELGTRYQAQLDLADGRIVGMEASLSRTLPGRGWVEAEDWIESSESEEEVAAVSDWLVREVSQHTRDVFVGVLNDAAATIRISPKQAGSARARQGLATAMKYLGPVARRVDFLAGPAETAHIRDDKVLFSDMGVRWTLDLGVGDPWQALAQASPEIKRLKISLRSPFAGEEALRKLSREARVRGLALLGADVASADDLTLLKRVGAQFGQGPFLHKPCLAKEFVAQARSGRI